MVLPLEESKIISVVPTRKMKKAIGKREESYSCIHFNEYINYYIKNSVCSWGILSCNLIIMISSALGFEPLSFVDRNEKALLKKGRIMSGIEK
jgi:hypothetical protein